MCRAVSMASFWIALGSLLFWTRSSGDAQVQSSDGTEMHAGDFVKGVSSEFPVVGNRWNLLRLVLANTHDRPVELQVAMYFDVDPDTQYSRRVQIPPLTRIQTWLPVLVSDQKHITDRAYSYHILVRSLGDSTGLLPDQFGSLQLDRTLQVESDEAATGLFHTPPLPQILDTEPVEPKTVDAFEFLMTGRYAKGVRRNWKTLSPGFSSGGQTGMQGLDHLVLTNDALLDDPEGQNAVRRWLFGGGRLWVMLDRVDSQVLELILGDRYQGQELERVELTSVELVNRVGKISSTRQYGIPVPMTRLLIENVDLHSTVDGWPAAFWIDYGRGQVLVTTLGADGWVHPRVKSDPLTLAGSGWETEEIPNMEYEEIIAPLLADDEASAVIRPVLSAQMEGYIGFRIPARSKVVGVLMGYAMLSLLFAVWLWRTNRLPLFGILGPVLALLAAATLLGIRPAGSRVPATAVVSQLVTPMTGSDDIRVLGVVGWYAKDASPFVLSGDSRGWMIPERDGFRSGIRILSYDDQFSWDWEKLRSQPGFHTASFEWAGRVERLSAVATFDEQGLSGTLTLPSQLVPEDAIIDSAHGRIGTTIEESGTWTARQSDTLSREQYLSANLLGDEQRRRIATLKQLSETPSRPWDSDQPRLLCWTQPWDLGFEFSDNYQRQGSALVSIPLEFRRPPVGSRVTIPGPLLPFREVVGPDGKAPVGLYSYRNHEWLEKRYSTSTWLGFEIPDVVLPLSLHNVNLQMAVTGPVGQLELWRWDGRERVSLHRWDNPVGTLSVTLDENAGLSLSDDGKLLLFLSAGAVTFDSSDSSADQPRSNWRIESLELSLEGTILEPES